MSATPTGGSTPAPVGSLAGGYPLGLLAPDDPRASTRLSSWMETCFVHGAVFQDMVHSGINPYLTLHVRRSCCARAICRHNQVTAGRCGSWPVQPVNGRGHAPTHATCSGCMGDGHILRRRAEWVDDTRESLWCARRGSKLILASGIAPRMAGRGRASDVSACSLPLGEVSWCRDTGGQGHGAELARPLGAEVADSGGGAPAGV